MKLCVQRLAHASELPLPAYATSGSAGLDLLAAISADIQLNPAQPGFSLERITKSKDPNFWSFRVSDNLRIIAHRTGEGRHRAVPDKSR